MTSDWYCRVMGSELGPLSGAQLLEMVRSHQLTQEDSVRKGPTGEWVGAYRVKGLFQEGPGSMIIAAHLPPTDPVPQPLPAAPVREAEWFCISSGSRLGPMTFEALRQLAARKQLQPTDRVWSNMVPKRRDAGDVKGLFPATAAV